MRKLLLFFMAIVCVLMANNCTRGDNDPQASKLYGSWVVDIDTTYVNTLYDKKMDERGKITVKFQKGNNGSDICDYRVWESVYIDGKMYNEGDYSIYFRFSVNGDTVLLDSVFDVKCHHFNAENYSSMPKEYKDTFITNNSKRQLERLKRENFTLPLILSKDTLILNKSGLTFYLLKE